MNDVAAAFSELRPSQYLGYAAGEIANNLTFQMIAVPLEEYPAGSAGPTGFVRSATPG